jgi:hypothetical protein
LLRHRPAKPTLPSSQALIRAHRLALAEAMDHAVGAGAVLHRTERPSVADQCMRAQLERGRAGLIPSAL